MPPRSRGNYAIRKLRPRKRVGKDSISYTIPLVGPYADLQAAEPAIDSPFTGYPAAFKVSEVSLEETGGGSGRMLVTIEQLLPGTDSGDDSPIAEPIYESDYAEERRPIEEHKRCGYLEPNRPFYEYPDRKKSPANPSKTAAEVDASTDNKVYKQREWHNWSALDAADYHVNSQDPHAWTLAQYQALKAKGRNDYPVNYPVCSKTSYHRGRPSSGASVNKVSTPPSQCSPPDGYTYVKCGDRATKQGRLYTRVESWRGYDSTDALLFAT